MKKFLLSFLSAFIIFTLSAQIVENFSDYNVGGKIAAQAQAMGRTYWTTWSNVPGGSEDAPVAEIDRKKAGHFTGGGSIDQVLFLGGAPGTANCKTEGVWELTFKMWVPTDKAGYFNIQSKSPVNYATNEWACQFYFGSTSQTHLPTPGIGTMDCGGTSAATFTFQHDTWTDVKLIMDMDADHAEIIINGNSVYTWTYTDGTFGTTPPNTGCIKQIDAMNIYPGESFSEFYITDIVFRDPNAPEEFPIMNVTPTSITESIIEGENEIITNPITVANTGTAEGEYEAVATCEGEIVWLTLTGDAEGTVAVGGSKSFNAVINPSELEVGEHKATILVETNDEAHALFTIPCKLTITLGIDDFKIKTAIFPNPASDVVNVVCNTIVNSIQLINNNGQIVYNHVVNNDNITIDTSNLSAGYYFIKLFTHEGTHSVKLVLK